MTYDISLPTSRKIIFPSMCVVCETREPEGKLNLSILGITTPSIATMAADRILDADIDPKYYGSNTTNEIDGIPACPGCSAQLKQYHRLLKIAYYTAWIPGFVPMLFLSTPQLFNIPFLIACAISPGLFTLIFPPAFGATFVNNSANFEFKSKLVAEEFRKLNPEIENSVSIAEIEGNS